MNDKITISLAKMIEYLEGQCTHDDALLDIQKQLNESINYFVANYEKEKARIAENQRQEALCSGCKFSDCGYCDRYDQMHCHCPCDNCKEEDGKMSNYSKYSWY